MSEREHYSLCELDPSPLVGAIVSFRFGPADERGEIVQHPETWHAGACTGHYAIKCEDGEVRAFFDGELDLEVLP